MASGLPVVACNVGAVPELVQSDNTGSLVSPRRPDELAQAIIALLADQETCRQMGQAGRQRAQDFALEVVMDSLINIYSNANANDR
jgi:glycosyltransferase involved in cell wall biosynthesis